MRPHARRAGSRQTHRFAIRQHIGCHGCPASSAGSGSRRWRPAGSDSWLCGKFAGAWSTWYLSDQILLCDDFAEPRIVGDELLDEYMNTVLEDVIHMAVLQAVADAAGVALRRPLAPIGDANLVEIPHKVFITACERSRQRIIENQEVCDQPRLQGFAVNPVIGGQCRDRAENGT